MSKSAKSYVTDNKYVLMLQNGTDSFKELITLYFSIILIAATVFSVVEHQAWFNSLWWAFVTALTIGYGDFYPHTVVGKIDAVLLMHLVTLFIIPIIIARMANKAIRNDHEFTEQEQAEIKATLKRIEKRMK